MPRRNRRKKQRKPPEQEQGGTREQRRRRAPFPRDVLAQLTTKPPSLRRDPPLPPRQDGRTR